MRPPILTLPASLTALGLFAISPVARAADPTTADCLNANDKSIELRNDHKLRAAREQLLVCAATSCPADVRKECMRRVDEVNAAIPTILFEAKDGAGKDLSAVKVTMDGAVIAERLEGTALSIDPGDHAFTFETAGQPVVQKQFVIGQGEKDRRERIVFGATEGPSPSPPPMPPPPNSGLGTQRILALVAGGVGVVGVGLGTAFGLIAMSKKSDAQNACPGATCSTQLGSSKWSDAGSAGNVSTVAFVVGAVGLAGAAALWFTAPSGSASAGTQVGVGPGTLQVRGTW